MTSKTAAVSSTSLTSQQQMIVDFGKNGSGNAVVIARAGCGKTFTLRQLAKVLRGSIAITAFNKKISKEIAEAVRDDGTPNCTVNTMHGFGLAAVKAAYPKTKIEGKGGWGAAGFYKFDRIVEEIVASGTAFPKSLIGFAKKAVDLAKQRAIGVTTPLFDEQAWMDIVEHFSLDMEIPENAHDIPAGQDPIRLGLRLACMAMKRGIEMSDEVIDFADMLYLPLYLNIPMTQYSNVLVDEAQDTNPARRLLVRRMMKPDARAFFVGDDHQAIYGFTGADNDALAQIVEDFSATTMGLTTTFRCGKNIVKEAKRYVADIEAAPSNHDGEVIHWTETTFMEKIAGLVPSDVILCRNTKPLVQTAFALIRRGVGCHVEGRDIGKSILNLIGRWKSVTCLEVLRDKLTDYLDAEVAKLNAKGNNAQIEVVTDRVETVFALIDGLPPGSTVMALRSVIETMFADSRDGEPVTRVRLMTIHRSKGLEFPRVFIWGANRYQPSRFAKKDWEIEQEMHLSYVAITRAEKTLVHVSVQMPDVAGFAGKRDAARDFIGAKAPADEWAFHEGTV
jgi:superfamily I DNA/RNA helicase